MQPNTEPKRAVDAALASTATAAAFLAMRDQTLRVWASKQTGPIQPVRIGSRLRWRWSDLRALAGEQVAA